MKIIERIQRSIAQTPSPVVLRAELARFGSASQVTEALRQLQQSGRLQRIGTGVYAKTRRSSVTGALVPAGSLETLATEALRKLGTPVQPGTAARRYNDGQTTQLPGTFVAHTGQRRIRRRIEVGGRSVTYENHFGRAAPDA